MKSFFLRLGSEYLAQAKPYPSRAAAVRAFEEVARDLERFGQRIEASIHVADSIESAREYPDWVLSLGPRGGVRLERA